MRIAFVCKRRYMDKDVILDRYARLYEIPYQLAALGHDVLGLCLSYQGDQQGVWEHPTPGGTLRWVSHSLGAMLLPALINYPRRAFAQLKAFRPDVIIGSSDIAHVALGEHLASQLGVPFIADLYDNFESFGMARIPGAVYALRRAVRKADIVSCTSQALVDYVRDNYSPRGILLSLPSTVDMQVFKMQDRLVCRRALDLPENAKLIGTAGGLYADKGIETLYRGFERFADKNPDAHLVLAGPVDQHLPPPAGPRIHYLGRLPHFKVAELFGALDLGVIYLRDTPFGRYCFPQKAYEMAACGLPIVAADVGAMRTLLAEQPQCLYRADDPTALAAALQAGFATLPPPAIVPEDWRQLVGKLDKTITELPNLSARP